MTNKTDRIAIFDLDGCVADDRWRRGRIPELANKTTDYDEYNAGIKDDPVLARGAEILKAHLQEGDFIIFTTARPFRAAKDTCEWIARHFQIMPNQDFIIMMRKDNDDRHTIEVKREFVEGFKSFAATSGRRILVAYDDRQDICLMYRDQCGLNTIWLNENGVQTLEAIPTAAPTEERKSDAQGAAGVLQRAASSLLEQQSIYGNYSALAAQTLETLFPKGANLRGPDDFKMFVTISRLVENVFKFVNSGMHNAEAIREVLICAAYAELLSEESRIEGVVNKGE